jgi:DNA polymerase I-like protein with 3'-5' exonuclease and polymerase domains
MSHGVNAWLKLSTNNKIHHHCSVGCATHRMSHRKPNLGQTMSGTEFRKLFTAAPGMVMVGADLAGIELRMLAHYLARHDGGRYAKILLEDDIHQVNADAIGVSRKLVKNISYGFMYGASDRKLGEIYDPKLAKSKQIAKGKEIRAAYVAAIDGMDKLLAGVTKRAQDGFIKAIDGRKLILDSDHKALNFLLQGSAACVAKRWLLINYETIKEINIEAYQLGFIHDELQFETYPPHVNDLRTSLVHSATAAGEFYNLRCRIDAESSTGDTWADTH